jgi:hypothetical protein
MAAVLGETDEAKRFGVAEAVKAVVATRAASLPEEREGLLGHVFERLRGMPLDSAIDLRVSELAEQRVELQRWLQDGLSALQRRLDEAVQTHHDTSQAQMKVTADAIAQCHTDLELIVEAIRTLAVRTQAQDDHLADAAVAATLTLRQDVDASTLSLRSALRSQTRRTERVERVVSDALAEQRRFTTRMVVALGVAQVLGLAAVVVVFG